MRILITKPEPSNQEGGLTIALNRVITQLTKINDYEIFCLEINVNNQFTVRPLNRTPKTTIVGSIEEAIDYSAPRVVIGVGWHTWSERVIQIAKHNGCRTIFWSHGVGATAWYVSKPLLSIARLVARAHQLIDIHKTLSFTDELVIAYERKRWQDTRSIDELIARWMNVGRSVIPNAIDSSFWTPLKEASTPKPWVVSIGRMEWQKGMRKAFEILIRANHCCSDPSKLKFLVMHAGGRRTSKEAKAIQTLCDQHNAEEQIIEMVGLPATDRRELLRQSLCLLCWSDSEYQSLSVLEALSCGCPVVSRPVGWLRHHPVPGVVIANDQKRAVSLVMRMETDQHWRCELAEAARESALSQHHTENVIEHWKTLINQIALQ